jgi:hypothetical protein
MERIFIKLHRKRSSTLLSRDALRHGPPKLKLQLIYRARDENKTSAIGQRGLTNKVPGGSDTRFFRASIRH